MMPPRPPIGPPPMMPPSRPPVSPFASGLVAAGLAIAVLIGVPIAVVLVIFLWPAARSFGTALASLIDTAPNLIAGGFLLALASGAVVVLSRGWAGVLRALAQARKERIIKMQHGQPIDIRDVTPIANRMLEPALQAHYGVALAEAKREHPELRALHYVNQIRSEAPPLIEASPAPAGNIPTFAELLDGGKVGPSRPLILGYDAATAQPIDGDWNSLYSCGVGALQGAGKSWLIAFLLAQSALQGGRLIVCDRHAEGGNAESLGSRIAALSPAFMCDIATTPDAILSALKLASDKLAQRMAGRGGNWPIIVVIDEWTSLLRTSVGAVLPGYLEDISEQGRKFNVNALLSAQGWTKDTAGVVRNRLTSHYVLRQRPDEARYQLGLPAGVVPLDVRLLPDATGYLLDVRGNLTRIVVPRMTSQDLVRVGQLIASSASVAGQPFGFQPAPVLASTARAPEATQNAPRTHEEGTTHVPSAASGRASSLAPESALAAALFLAGKSLAEITEELRGMNSKKGGAPYRRALAEVTELVRQAVDLKGEHS